MNAHLKKVFTTIGTLLSATFLVWGLISCSGTGGMGPLGSPGGPVGGSPTDGSVSGGVGDGTIDGGTIDGGSQGSGGLSGGVSFGAMPEPGPDPMTDVPIRPKYVLAACNTCLEGCGDIWDSNTEVLVHFRGRVFEQDNSDATPMVAGPNHVFRIRYPTRDGVQIKDIKLENNSEGVSGFFDVELKTVLVPMDPVWKFFLNMDPDATIEGVSGSFTQKRVELTKMRAAAEDDDRRMVAEQQEEEAAQEGDIKFSKKVLLHQNNTWFPFSIPIIQTSGFPEDYEWDDIPIVFDQCDPNLILDRAVVLKNIKARAKAE